MDEKTCNDPTFQPFCWWGPPTAPNPAAGTPPPNYGPPTTGNYTTGNHTVNQGDEARQIFDKFDRNHDGAITWKEVKRTLRRAFNHQVKEYHSKFDQVDHATNGDGKITVDELENALRHHD